MAEALGVSVKGLAKGVGSGSQKDIEAMGKAVGKIFGKRDD